MAIVKKRGRKSLNYKTDIVLERLRGESLEELSRKHKITIHEIEEWVEKFINGGKGSLKSKPQTIEDYELTQAKHIIADQAITIDILKKRNLLIDKLKKN